MGIKVRAIDLYAGIGGWSLGLRLAGVDVVKSYEWWQAAVDTHNGNHGGALVPTDVRLLKLEDMPDEIDLVVGSPPCTEFSYSNRGGSGNLDEGLKDLIKFLEIVEYLQPTYWVLENVPRVAGVLRRGLTDSKHPLYRFRNLEPQIEVVDFSDYGTPQSRRRCIAGKIPFNLVEAYRSQLVKRTLGDVVKAIGSSGRVVDPVWGCDLSEGQVSERESEPILNAEELRMNREAKTYHPVYNDMAFPDVLNAPARTVTATCTRVSRESIVIEDEVSGKFRRLSIRERACLQGFPITYQFYAKSFATKATMVGNAIPPTYTYLLAQAALGVHPDAFKTFAEASAALKLPDVAAPITPPPPAGRTYRESRSFRSALPGLRFKSGMRFELANARGGLLSWKMRFFYGPSTDVREIALDDALSRSLQDSDVMKRVKLATGASFSTLENWLKSTNPDLIQRVWTRRSNGVGPYDLVDRLGDLAASVITTLDGMDETLQHAVIGYVMAAADIDGEGDEIPGARKLKQNAIAIFAGLWVGAWFNELPWHSQQQAAAA